MIERDITGPVAIAWQSEILAPGGSIGQVSRHREAPSRVDRHGGVAVAYRAGFGSALSGHNQRIFASELGGAIGVDVKNGALGQQIRDPTTAVYRAADLFGTPKIQTQENRPAVDIVAAISGGSELAVERKNICAALEERAVRTAPSQRESDEARMLLRSRRFAEQPVIHPDSGREGVVHKMTVDSHIRNHREMQHRRG